MTERINVVELRNSLSDVLNRAEYRGERIVIHRRDKDAAAIISMADLRLLEQLVRAEEDRIDIATALAARKESPERIPLGDFCRELGVNDESGEPSLRSRPDAGRRARPVKASKKGS
ncbi:type II toxin-antitoxin system Phd/YefM family antitoxin [Singulisphaera acidiphila]